MKRSSSTPPSSRQSTEYWAPPGAIRSTSLESSRWSSASAPGPLVSTWPMWETSKTPARSRTAACSARMPAYCTGISQPANGTRRAPAATWRSYRGVRCNVSASAISAPTLAQNRAAPAPGGRRRPARLAALERHRLLEHRPVGQRDLERDLQLAHAGLRIALRTAFDGFTRSVSAASGEQSIARVASVLRPSLRAALPVTRTRATASPSTSPQRSVSFRPLRAKPPIVGRPTPREPRDRGRVAARAARRGHRDRSRRPCPSRPSGSVTATVAVYVPGAA